MIFFKNRRKTIFCLALALISLGGVTSCENMAPDLKGELLQSLKGENVDGFYFATDEEEGRMIASLTNSALQNFITLDSSMINLALKYTLVKEVKASTKKIYKTEIAAIGSEFALVVTDIATDEVVSRTVFLGSEPHNSPDGLPSFDSLEECISDFYCTTAPAFQCEANRTCEVQSAHFLCCLKGDQCVYVTLIIRPTTFKCRLSILFPNQGVFVLRR